MIASLTKLPPHARTVALLLLALVALLCVTAILKLGGWFWQSHQYIGDLEPRTARLLGYKVSTEQLRASEALVNRQIDGLVFSVEVDAGSVGTRVQDDVGRLLEGAGMSVIDRQVVGSTAHETLEEIRVDISATGTMEALDQTLADIGNARPLLLIQTLEITPVAVRRGEPRQEVTVDISLRAVRLL